MILDLFLASLYEVENRTLKQAVRRNIDRFPKDFMFELTKLEWNEVITNCDNLPNTLKFSPQRPFAFTEQGVAMLSSVLKSKKAVQVNINIIRAFVHLRRLVNENLLLKQKIESLEKKYDRQFLIVFEAIDQIIQEESKPKKTIGFIKK